MRILWLDHPDRVDRYDKWLHTEFAKSLNDHCTVFVYGPKMDRLLPPLAPIAYAKEKSMKWICHALKIDAIVVDTKSATYNVYYPQKQHESITWLPDDFAENKTCKVVIEEDYHYEEDDSWHKGIGARMVLQRHFSQSIRGHKCPVRFFPFSVDTSVFKPGKIDRVNTIAMVGSTADPVYKHRVNACKELSKHGLATTWGDKTVTGDAYILNLQSYTSHISCSSTYDITPAKMFEIMASGSVLFTNRFCGIDSVFDQGTYVDFSTDMSDVVEKGKRILDDSDFRSKIVNNAMKCIYARHTNDIRCKELIRHIKDVI